jgi:hypothetical protein
MPDWTSLLPQPPQQNQGFLGIASDPAKLLYGLNALNSIQRFQSEQGALDAYRQSLGPNGQVDPGTLVGGMNQRGTTWGGPEMISQALAQRGQQISNDTNAFGQWAAQNDVARAVIAGLASKQNPTADDVNAAVLSIGRQYDLRAVPDSVLQSISKNLTSDPAGIPAAIRRLQAQVAGAAQSMQRTDLQDLQASRQAFHSVRPTTTAAQCRLAFHRARKNRPPAIRTTWPGRAITRRRFFRGNRLCRNCRPWDRKAQVRVLNSAISLRRS